MRRDLDEGGPGFRKSILFKEEEVGLSIKGQSFASVEIRGVVKVGAITERRNTWRDLRLGKKREKTKAIKKRRGTRRALLKEVLIR